MEDKREASDIPWLEAVDVGGCRQTDWKWVAPCDWLQVHVWLCLVGP